MAVDFEALVAQAKQLTGAEQARLIMILSEAQNPSRAERGVQPSTLEELRRVCQPWAGFPESSARDDDQEADDFIEWRREQRALDRELEAKRSARLSAIWGD